MMRSPWLRALRRWLSPPRPSTAARQRPRFHARPWLEVLEDRVVPADLTILKTGPGAVAAGSTLTYSVSVTNTTTAAATNVAITDALPSELTLIAEAQVSGPDSFINTSTGNTASFTAASVGAGNTDVFQIVAAAASTLTNGTPLSNTASFTDASGTGSSTVNTVVAPAGVALTKAGPESAAAGAAATYTLSFSNTSATAATGATLTDALPTGLTLNSETQVSGPDTFTNSSTGNTVRFSGAVSPGSLDVFQVVATPIASLTNGTLLSNFATFTSSVNNGSSNTVLTTVTTSANLAVAKTGPSTITAGTTVTYTITLGNLGPSDAAAVTLTDTLPTGLNLVSEMQVSGPDAFTNSTTDNTPSFTATTMGAGNTDVFQVVVSTASTQPAGRLGTQTASVSSTTPDPDPSNNSSSIIIDVVSTTTPCLFKNGPSNLTLTGASVSGTYTLTLCNMGTATATNVVLTDALPTGLTLVSATAAMNNPDTFINTSSGNNVSFTAATMGPGNTDLFDVVFSASTCGTFTDTATATSPNFSPSPISSSPFTTLVQAPTTTTPSTPGAVMACMSGQAINLSATVTAAACGPVNEGTMTFSLLGRTLTSSVSNGQASASLPLPSGVAAGTYPVTFSYDDTGGMFLPSSNTATLRVNSASTGTSFTNVSITPQGGNVVETLTAQVSSSCGTVSSGTVTFDPENLFVSAPVVNGIASVSVTLPMNLAGGNQTITANYNGSGAFDTSQTGPVTVHLMAFNSFLPTTVQYSANGEQTVTSKFFGIPLVFTYSSSGQLVSANGGSLFFLLLLLRL
jgi:uncharacterized repeat protein (TIGR01451 family)